MSTNLRYDVIRSVIVLFSILIQAKAEPQDSSNVQHLPDIKFNLNEYSEYPDNEDRDKGSLIQPDGQQTKDNLYLRANGYLNKEESISSSVKDKNITWDANWAAQLKLKQISAVSMNPNGNIAVFHRGKRIWGLETFDIRNRFDPNNGAIAQDTIILLDKSGKVILEWGRNMFYLPHGLTIDQSGNYWITDVAMHQVFKFDAQDIDKHMEELKRAQFNSEIDSSKYHTDTGALFEHSILKPSIILGEAFIPGDDDKRFCKPTAVAVHSNGDFFVSDGYCNSRIIKFNKNGERILHWGRHWGIESNYAQLPPPYAFLVPHALALAIELNYIFVADRENGRVLCFFANNGTFHKEYRHPFIGTKIYSVAYAREKLYLINGQDPYISSPTPVGGFVLDIYSGKLESTFGPKGNMKSPHDLYVTEDSSEIYVVGLNNEIYRFLQGVNDSVHIEDAQSTKRRRPKILVHPDTKDADIEKTNMTKLILGFGSATVSFITICVAIAAIIARCQKRGCLLTMRKRMRWEAERRENFKLSSLLENRRGRSFKFLEKRPNTRDFSKLNTEPETSEDEHPENSLAKVI